MQTSRRLQWLTSRIVELELLTTAFMVLFGGLAVLSLSNHILISSLELLMLSGFVLLFYLMSFAMAWRGWNENQVILPMTALLASCSVIVVQRLGPDLLARYGDAYQQIAFKQVMWVLLGVLLTAAIVFVPWRIYWLRHYRYTWLVLGIALVVITIFFGVERNGARLWLNLGFLQFQPVELLKLLLVIYFATYLDDHRDVIGLGRYRIFGISLPPLPYLIPLALMWGITMALMIIQRDLGVALLFAIVMLTMLYLVTGQVAYVVTGIVLFALGAALIYPYFGYVRIRFLSWYNPWFDASGAGYQMIQALYSLASGGLFGAGLGQGDPASVPESHTDFIFTSLGEEMGLFGTLAVTGCYLLFACQGYIIALRTRDGFQQLLAAGLTTALVAQAFIIMAGTTNLIPLTGITLPFMSYGGSSMLMSFVLVGMLLRISASNKPAYVL